MKKPIYRTVIQITVLSEEPIPEGMDLEEIAAECEDGEFCGKFEHKKLNEPIAGKEAADAIKDTGSNTEFFGMDNEGNELEEEEEL
jgi:hypothetical protein